VHEIFPLLRSVAACGDIGTGVLAIFASSPETHAHLSLTEQLVVGWNAWDDITSDGARHRRVFYLVYHSSEPMAGPWHRAV
jgi:hypothetical protein